MTSELEQIIEMLIEKLGPLGEHVWTVYVRQVYLMAVQEFVFALLLLAGGGVLVALSKWLWAQRQTAVENNRGKSYPWTNDTFGWDMATMVAVIGACCVIVFGVASLLGCLDVLNPEYYAIQMLLGR